MGVLWTKSSLLFKNTTAEIFSFLLLPLLPKRIELISCSNIVQTDEEYLSGDCPYSKPETIDITKAVIQCS
jgi:hypothetical protein